MKTIILQYKDRSNEFHEEYREVISIEEMESVKQEAVAYCVRNNFTLLKLTDEVWDSISKSR